MNIFREAADKARQDNQTAQQKLKEARTQSLDRAAQEKRQIEKELEVKLQTARELLEQINAEGLLNSIKNDVWGMGKIATKKGSFVVRVNQKSDQSSPDPCSVESEIKEWPDAELSFSKDGLPNYHSDVHQGSRSSTTYSRYWKDDGHIFTGLKISIQHQEGKSGILISRTNSTNIGSLPAGKSNDFFANSYEEVTAILQKIVYEDVRQGQLPGDLLNQAIEAGRKG